MKSKVVSIRDSKTESYSNPWHAKTIGEAERNFKTLVNDDKTQLSKYPEDFDLFEIGEFDDQTGLYTCLDTPRHVAKAIHLVDPI